jgi:hypothetical protein
MNWLEAGLVDIRDSATLSRLMPRSADRQASPPGTSSRAVEQASIGAHLPAPRQGRPGTGLHIPSARKPVQTTIKPTMITARKLEEVISSRMTTPMPQSGKDHRTINLFQDVFVALRK